MANNYGSLEGTMDANGILGGEIQFNGAGGRVKDVQVNDVSVVDANGIAKIDLTPYAEKEDVYDKQTIDTALEGKADTDDIPTDLSDLQDDSDHRLVTDAEKTEWSGKADTSDIPTDLADLNDDATHRLVTDTEKSTWDNKADVSDIPTVNNPTITIQKNGQNVDTFSLNQTTDKVIDISVPTKTSDLQNDNSFITNTVNNLANYYLKSQTYTQAEVDALIDAAVNGRFQKVNVLPATGEPNIIYLVPKATPETSNACDEYIWQDNAWELIGSTDIDLSGYVTDDELTTALADYLTTSAFNTAIANYYTKTEIGNLLDGKVDKVPGKGLSTNDYDNTAKGIVDGVTNALAGKVDKVNGKGLSTEDYTTTEKNKLAGISTNAKKVEASTTNGNIKIDDTETQVYDDSEIQDKIDETTTSISGNPISISGLKSNQLAKNPTITLEPIQDLHGQSKPYPAGGGKNKLNADDYYGSYKQSDGSYKTTASNFNTIYIYATSDMIGKTYTFSAYLDLTKEASPTYALTRRVIGGVNGNGTTIYANNKGLSSVSFTPTSTSDYVFLTYGSNGGNNYTISQLQIEEGETATAYAPYENVCPISGYDKIEVLSCGKNIACKRLAGMTINGSGVIAAFNGYDLILAPVKANTTYVTSGISDSHKLYGFFTQEPTTGSVTYNNARTVVEGATTGYSFTTPISGWVAFRTGNSAVNVQCEEGSSATTYEPYNKTTDLSESLGQTMYGGSLDVRTGKLTVDTGFYTFDGTESWSIAANGHASHVKSDMKPGLYANGKCSKLQTGVQTGNIQFGSNSGGGNTIYIRNAVSEYGLDTEAKVQAFTTGMQITYLLITPFTIQLTPHEISLLKDYAYVSTNGTNISLDYHNGELASLADVSQLGETVNELGFSLIAFNVPIAGETISNGYKNLYTTIDVDSYTPITLIEQNPWNEKCTFTLAYTNKAVISIHIRCTEASYTIPSNIAPLTVLCIPNKKIINPIK